MRLFDPTVCKVNEYRVKYPELDTVVEFNGLDERALIFVWWYSNPTSPLVTSIKDDKQRVAEAMKKSGFNGAGKKEDILKLKFPDYLSIAIDRMRRFVPDVRIRAKMMVESIISEYEKIVSAGVSGFVGANGETNYNSFVNTTSKIVETLPMLIQKMEEGYGITYTSSEEEQEAKEVFSRSWYYTSTVSKDLENNIEDD